MKAQDAIDGPEDEKQIAQKLMLKGKVNRNVYSEQKFTSNKTARIFNLLILFLSYPFILLSSQLFLL